MTIGCEFRVPGSARWRGRSRVRETRDPKRETVKMKAGVGYTLMELVVVLALLAVATAVVTPAIAHGFGNLQLHLAASTLQSVLGQARVHAVYEARSYRVVVSAPEETPRTLCLVRDDGKTTQRVALPAGIGLVAAVADGEWSEQVAPVYFFADGTSQFAQLELRGAREQRVQLQLDPLTARARVTQMYRAGEAAGTAP